MRAQLLGALEIRADDGRLGRVAGCRLRALLAFLLLHENEVVTRDALIEAVWDGVSPPSAEHGLDVLISRLRRVLGPVTDEQRLRTVPGGYVLDVLPGELDVDRFEDGVADGRRAFSEGRLADCVTVLRQALDEWSGAALGDVAYVGFASIRSRQLEELRLNTIEELSEAELLLGRHADAVTDLEAVLDANPLRERARAQLMLALYRSGRHAEALETYRTGRRMLADDLGIEPGEELRRLHREILEQDHSLDLQGAGESSPIARPQTRYARSGDVAIAYQVSGGGPFDVVYLPSFMTNVELAWQVRSWAFVLRRLGAFSRLIRFDRRGTGMSDRRLAPDRRMLIEDVCAVMDAAVSPSAAVVAPGAACGLALLLAAAHPERVWALVLLAQPNHRQTVGDASMRIADVEHRVAEVERIWTEPGYAEAVAHAGGAVDAAELGTLWRQSATLGTARALVRQESAIEAEALRQEERVTVPTLRLAQNVDHLHWSAPEEVEPALDAIEAFLCRVWSARASEPVTSQAAGRN